MQHLEVLNPVAKKNWEVNRQRHPAAPRLSDLNGKAIGVYWNMKTRGDAVSRRAGENLSNRFRDVQIRYYSGSLGGRGVMSEEDAVRIAKECDAVVGVAAD